MPKRAGTPVAPPAKRSELCSRISDATSGPCCDRCHQVVYETQMSEKVNGRTRHVECWPAYMKLDREWEAAFAAFRADRYGPNRGQVLNLGRGGRQASSTSGAFASYLARPSGTRGSK